MLVHAYPAEPVKSTRALAEALEARYGPRFAVWHTDEFLLGVHDGRLTLHTLGGEPVPPPKVVCVRQLPGSMCHDREVTLLRHLEHMGATLLNSPRSHVTCRNKIWQLQELATAGLPVPASYSYATGPLDGVVRSPRLDVPCVVKPVNGNRGRGVFLAPDHRTLRETAGGDHGTPLLFQEYVASSHGRDLRVVVVRGEPVAAVVRTACNGALASNIAHGGTAEVCTGRYPEAEALAASAARTLGLAIAGVDLLFTATGAHTLCEVNAVPGWRPEMTPVIPAITDCIDHYLREAEGEGGG